MGDTERPDWTAQVIHAPHPTARHASVVADLADAASRFRAVLAAAAE